MKILVTGAAGFIGFHLARDLLEKGHELVGFDSLSDYYSVQLKKDRLTLLQDKANFRFVHGDLADADSLTRVFDRLRPEYVINLAAQAGVRYSLENPQAYIQSNLVGFANILENCRRIPVRHLVYASSSSVYGLNQALPFREEDNADHPASLYAATKKSNELMAHAYSHLYGIPCTGLRFFTVYGPWGRPDMAPHLFLTAILRGEPIKVFNHGQMQRDFTYVDDIVEGIVRLLPSPPAPNPDWNGLCPDSAASSAAWRILNIGNNEAVPLPVFISELEQAAGKKAILEYLPMQPGDVKATYADLRKLSELTGYVPHTPLHDGIRNYVAWYLDYFRSVEIRSVTS